MMMIPGIMKYALSKFGLYQTRGRTSTPGSWLSWGPPCQVASDTERFLERNPAAPFHDLSKGLALDVTHGDIGQAVLGVGGVHRADARVPQPPGGLCLALEALQEPWVHAGPQRQHLEGDVAAQPKVLGEVDHALPAGTELADDLVVREPFTRLEDLTDVKALRTGLDV